MSMTESRPQRWNYERRSVAGKRVIVTGGTKGIGRATALLLAQHGAKVVVFGRHEQALQDAMADLKEAGDEVYGLTADHAKVDDVERVFAFADEKIGGVDVLINNAGEPAETITEDDAEHFQYLIDSMLVGPMHCAKHAIERMKGHGGTIINVGSMSAESRGASSNIYVAAKTGLRGWTDALRKEVGQDGIAVTLIEPGKVDTDFFDLSREEAEEKINNMEMLRSEDLAEAVLYILSQPERVALLDFQIVPRKQELK